MPASIKENDDLLLEYIKNTGNFHKIIHNERDKRFKGDMTGLFVEEVILPQSEKADGAVRGEEQGYRINVDYLQSIGIDPKRVLFFRITQPSVTPVPELYWTSDYFETVFGLTVEIPPHQRKTAVILVSDLQTINGNGGLIQDINDDSGLAVRQIGKEPFNQNNVITRLTHSLHRS